MFRYVIAFISIVVVVFAASSSVFAIDISPACNGSAANTDVCKSINQQSSAGTNPINDGLKDALLIVSYIAGAAAVVSILISAIRFITAQGDVAGIKSARDTLLYVIVGIFVIVLAQTIIAFVLDKVNL